MIGIGTKVVYHGSKVEFHGYTFTVTAYCCHSTRHVITGPVALRHVREPSITPVAERGHQVVVEQAITAQAPVLITYVAADGEWSTRIIEPLELEVTQQGRVIVRALDRRSREPRSFRLDRIHAAAAMPGSFQLLASEDERRALARIRAEIARVPATGYDNEMRWFPGCPVL
jgi:hypothetical protein